MLVWDATEYQWSQWRQKEEEEMSQLVVSPVTHEQHKVGVLPNVKVITGPRLLWRLRKDAEPVVLVTDGLACVLLQQLLRILSAELHGRMQEQISHACRFTFPNSSSGK